MRPGWRIIVRDDASSDGTPEILERLAARWPECIVLAPDRGERLGPRGNFTRLMCCSNADYVMFCDQDDIWLPSRLAMPLERMRAIEESLGRDTPVLVHTDLVVVDQELRRVAGSFWRYSSLNPAIGDTLGRLLVNNVVTGCATTINRALLRLAYPIPAAAVMHDWWLALVAAACGRLEYIPEPTVLYRQHGGNVIGAKPRRWSEAASLIARRLLGLPLPGCGLRPLCAQARTLLEHMKPRLSAEHQTTIRALADLQRRGFFRRRQEVLRHGLVKSDWASNLGWLALM